MGKIDCIKKQINRYSKKGKVREGKRVEGMEQKINVLLVDDRPENLLALEGVLGDLNYNLVRAYSGEEALKCLMKDEFAVILLDVQMPGLNGFETAEIIKSRPKTKDTPIIFITAISKEAENVFTGYSVGAIDYIFKPFEPNVLKSKIKSFITIYLTKKGIETKADLLLEKTQELQEANQELQELTFQLRKTEALAGIVRNTSMDTMITYNEDFDIVTVNPAVKKMFGYDETELIGKKVMKLIPALALAKEFGHKVKKRLEVIGVRKDTSNFPAEIQVGMAALEDQVIYACTVRDISELKQQMAALTHQALHDSLTALPNRTLLYDRLDQGIISAKKTQKPFSLIFIDLDSFKSINDALGHHYGDRLIQQVGWRLQSLVKETDTVARLGGDEFALFLPMISEEQTLELAKEINLAIEQPFKIDDHVLTIRLSQGIVYYPIHGENVETLMKRADISMYTAKKMNEGYSVFSPEFDTHSIEKLNLIGDLKDALESEKLMPYYQPLADIETNRIVGVEVLLRWIHPIHGFIPPSQFIPIAEQNGLMEKLTIWVLEKALQQSKEWREKGLHLNVSVNLSASNLQDMELSNNVRELLDKYRVDPSILTLEITESFIISNPSRAMEVLQRLSSMGVKLSIDDFGTGYSSLAYLKKLPVDEIKVDKSFVIDMLEHKNDEMIVRTVVNLAHNLGLRVVAEGIESKEVWDRLASFNCDTAQGYYLSAPIPAEELFLLYAEREMLFNSNG